MSCVCVSLYFGLFLSLLCQVCIWGSTIHQLVFAYSLIPRPYIRVERAWYTLLAHAPDLHGKPVGYYIRYRNVLP